MLNRKQKRRALDHKLSRWTLKRILFFIAITALAALPILNEPPALKSVQAQKEAFVQNSVKTVDNSQISVDKSVVQPNTQQAEMAKDTSVKKAEVVTPPVEPHLQLVRDAGIADSDFEYIDFIIGHESGWCVAKWENDIGYCPTAYRVKYSEYDVTKGYGLCQSTPAIKMATQGDDWRDNAITQLKWCNAYAQSRYGSWKAAYDHWNAQILRIGHGNW